MVTASAAKTSVSQGGLDHLRNLFALTLRMSFCSLRTLLVFAASAPFLQQLSKINCKPSLSRLRIHQSPDLALKLLQGLQRFVLRRNALTVELLMTHVLHLDEPVVTKMVSLSIHHLMRHPVDWLTKATMASSSLFLPVDKLNLSVHEDRSGSPNFLPALRKNASELPTEDHLPVLHHSFQLVLGKLRNGSASTPPGNARQLLNLLILYAEKCE